LPEEFSVAATVAEVATVVRVATVVKGVMAAMAVAAVAAVAARMVGMVLEMEMVMMVWVPKMKLDMAPGLVGVRVFKSLHV
jgi:hypothetical protein